jgi:predicted histone-like DNA-binding protein
MTAQYDLKPRLGPESEEGTPVLYPKVVPHGTKTLKDIMKDAANGSGLNPAVVQGVVTMLESKLAQYLADGYHVKLGNIGTFSATLSSRQVKTKEEIRAQSIYFDNVRFKASKELKKEIGLQMKLERVSAYKRFKTSSDEHTPEERFQMLTDYLDKHGFITRSGYSELTGLLKTKASTELKKWYQEKRIDKDGRAPHIVYKKRELQTGSSLQEPENQSV